jgi:two-component system response regulator HydG
VDVRVIAATNKQLEEEVSLGKFREDLYYRLNVVPITIPPLRERKEDIPILAEHFLEIYSKKNRKTIRGFELEAINAFIRYPWLGNVRELENIVERTVIMCRKDMVSVDDLPPTIAGSKQEDGELEFVVGSSLRDLELDAIVRTLRYTEGNRTKTASILGITRKTLQNKIKEYEIEI